MPVDAHIFGHVGCVSAEKSDSAMKKEKNTPHFWPEFHLLCSQISQILMGEKWGSFYYLMGLIATWGASCRHDSASPETGAWPSQVTSPNLASRHCHFQPLGVITKIWVGWENVWRWCWQSDCEYIGLLPLPQSGVSVITFIGKTQHWWSGRAEGEHCYGFCKEIQTCQSHKVSQKTQKCSRNPCPLLLDKHTCWDLML